MERFYFEFITKGYSFYLSKLDRLYLKNVKWAADRSKRGQVTNPNDTSQDGKCLHCGHTLRSYDFQALTLNALIQVSEIILIFFHYGNLSSSEHSLILHGTRSLISQRLWVPVTFPSKKEHSLWCPQCGVLHTISHMIVVLVSIERRVSNQRCSVTNAIWSHLVTIGYIRWFWH